MGNKSSSPPPPSVTNNNSNEFSLEFSNSNCSVTSFYLEEGRIKDKRLKDLIEMSSSEFSSFFKEELLSVY